MFEIQTSADYYLMLVADFDEFLADAQSGRKAIHCAISAYHMHDWVWHDWLKERADIRKELGLTSFEAFKDYLKGCVWLEILREIANGSKHFKRQLYKTHLVQGYDASPYGVGPYGTGYLLIDLGEVEHDPDEILLDEYGEPDEQIPNSGEQRFMTAASLLEVCVRFWKDFFTKYRPDLALAHSEHHPKDLAGPRHGPAA